MHLTLSAVVSVLSFVYVRVIRCARERSRFHAALNVQLFCVNQQTLFIIQMNYDECVQCDR